MNDYTCQYIFTHKKTGKHIIPQSWTEFYRLQEDHTNYHDEYRRTGTTHFPETYGPVICGVEDRINKFWQGASGYEKIGQLNCNGYTFNPIRMFLKNMHNHACMMGDKDMLVKAYTADKYFWNNNAHTYNLLPAPK